MSRASNSLKATDVTATPIKLKYSASYSNTTICDSGIYAQTGINGPVTITGSIPERTLRYRSARHLYYSNFLTGSFPLSGSASDNFLQSTAASGTFEGNTAVSASTDLRYFPTQSGARVKIINIPRSSFGEQVSKKSFFLESSDGTSYRLVDDGNGNIIDTLNNDVYVGNIIYPQGFVVITNADYYCAMDGGPITFPKSYIFDITQSVKSFNPIIGAIPDCAPVDSSSLDLFEYPYFEFPRYSINSVGLVTLDSTDSLTSRVGTYKSYYTVQSTYCGTSDEQPVTVELVDCSIGAVSAAKLACGVNGLTLTLVTPAPTATPQPTPTPSPSQTPTPSPTPTLPPPTPTSTTPPPTPTSTIPAPTPTSTIPPPTPTSTTPPPTPTAEPENYTLTLTNPGSNILSNWQLGGTFNTGDTVVITATWNGSGGTVPPSNSGRADLLLSNSSAGVSNSAVSACVPVGSFLTWSLTTTITFSYSVANSAFITNAVVNNGSASASTLTVTITSVNGIPDGTNQAGNKNNQSAFVC